jgi:hypothetical protein
LQELTKVSIRADLEGQDDDADLREEVQEFRLRVHQTQGRLAEDEAGHQLAQQDGGQAQDGVDDRGSHLSTRRLQTA